MVLGARPQDQGPLHLRSGSYSNGGRPCFIIGSKTEAAIMIPSTLDRPGAVRFWTSVVLTGCATGIAAAALTRLLEAVQRLIWGGTGKDLLDAAEKANAWRHVVVLLGAGVITGLAQIILKRLS